MGYERLRLTDGTVLNENHMEHIEDGIANIYDGYSNHNLLDNGWFTINQRNATSLSTGGYKVDRWKASNATGSISDDGINITAGSIFQNLEQSLIDSFTGKTLTASAIVDGTVVSSTGTMTATGIQFDGFELRTSDNSFSVYKHGLIRAAKLEIGSVSTLANDVMPNYTDELLRCQRYFYRLSAGSSRGNFGFSQIAGDSSTIYFCVQMPVPMRVSPSFTASSDDCIGASRSTGTNAISSISVGKLTEWAENTKVILRVKYTQNDVTTGTPYALFLAANSYLDFSADL